MQTIKLNGEGKYDGSAEMLLAKLDATGILLAVIDGNKGNGFSICTKDARIIVSMPTMLRRLADNIEAEHRKGIILP